MKSVLQRRAPPSSMFLFTTPTTTAAPPQAQPVLDAIRAGAERTGTGFAYLLDTAKRESALDPTAKASTSSATGLFQFIEQTWLGLVKSEGGKAGLPDEAKAVVARGDGTLTVADPAARQAILKLREDPTLASHMAGALTRQNRDALTAATGREPSSGELYMAHVLGARGARELIEAAGREPTRIAAADFPDAARANRNIFYDRSGRARGVGEVYAVLATPSAGRAASAPAPASEPAPSQPPGLNGMFQTGARPGPISDAVAKIWRVNNEGTRTRTAALSYFPRTEPAPTLSDTAADTVVPPIERAAVAVTAGEAPLAITVTRQGPLPSGPALPLPPRRPRADLLAAPPPGAGAAAPLSLSSFMSRPRP